MLTEVGKRRDEYSEKFNKELKNIKKNQAEMKNTITETKNTLEGMNGRLGGTEECISNLEGRIMETTQ